MKRFKDFICEETLKRALNSVELFGGANVIITNDPERRGKETDVIVLTRYAYELSYIIEVAKKAYKGKINRPDFYNMYAEKLNNYKEKYGDKRGIIDYAIGVVEDWVVSISE